MKIKVAYACNEAYINHTGISIISLLENNKDLEGICIYFIEVNVSAESKKLLRDIVESYARELVILPFDSLCSGLNVDATGRHIQTVYAKIFFSRIQSISKILYIDSDTIIERSLKELWELDISDYVMGAVETYTAKFRQELGMTTTDKFFNDGIVLINLDKFREEDIERKCLNFIEKFRGNPPVLSEGTLNFVCRGQIVSLHPKYNLMSGILTFTSRTMNKSYGRDYYTPQIINEAIAEPVIIHYLSAFYNRPWCTECSHPYKDRYLYYKSISPWMDMPLSGQSLSRRLKYIRLYFSCLPGKMRR